jgi:tetratricopeptide (TPR) repeat protein
MLALIGGAMSKKTKQVNHDVVLSGDIEHLNLLQRLYFSRRNWLPKAVKFTLVLLVAYAGVSLYISHVNQRRQAAEIAQNKLMVNVRQNVDTGNYQQAEQQIKNSPTSKDQELMLVSVYIQKGDYQSALNTYNDIAKKYGLDRGLAEAAGRVAEEAGDKKQAVYYYQQARDFIAKQKDYATKTADLAYYDNKIKTIQSSP